jgi:hypothetical protein
MEASRGTGRGPDRWPTQLIGWRLFLPAPTPDFTAGGPERDWPICWTASSGSETAFLTASSLRDKRRDSALFHFFNGCASQPSQPGATQPQASSPSQLPDGIAQESPVGVSAHQIFPSSHTCDQGCHGFGYAQAIPVLNWS